MTAEESTSGDSAGFAVASTDVSQREQSRGEYVVAVNSATADRLNLQIYGVTTHRVSHAGQEHQLRARCRVVIDESTADDAVRLDQTLRNVLGIPFVYDAAAVRVDLAPLNVSHLWRTAGRIAELLGRRYIILRVAKNDVSDIEKDLVRVPEDAFPLLGCSASSRVIVESVVENEVGEWRLIRRSIRAYEWTDEFGERRKKAQEPGFDKRFPHPEGTLGVDPDISGIYMDFSARKQLGVESLDCVHVRRDVWNAFLEEFREFGVVFFISLFGISLVAPIKQMTWAVTGVLTGIGLVVAITLTAINLRARGSA